MEKCAPCLKGPSGIEGHDDLFTHTMNARQMQFRCRSCGTFWVRQYSGAGSFAWTPPRGEHPGMDVPGRRTA
jgi:hypothetical protein